MLTKFRRTVIAAGSALIGKVRLVDSGGTEVTDGSEHAVKSRLIAGEDIIGKVGLVDSAGEELTQLDTAVKSLPATTVLLSGRKTVTTVAAREALDDNPFPCRWIIITSETDNTDIVVVGGPGVIAALATREGIPLNAGDSVVLLVDNVTKVYIDALVASEGVTFMAGN